MTKLLFAMGQYNNALTLLTQLPRQYPTDYYTHVTCGQLTQVIALISNDRRLMRLAEDYYQRAIQIDPFRARDVNGLYQQTLRQYAPRQDPRESG